MNSLIHLKYHDNGLNPLTKRLNSNSFILKLEIDLNIFKILFKIIIFSLI